MNIGMNIGMKRRNGDEGCLLGVLGGSLMGEVDTHMHILHSTFWGSWGVLGGYWSGLGGSLGSWDHLWWPFGVRWGSWGVLCVLFGVTWSHLRVLW